MIKSCHYDLKPPATLKMPAAGRLAWTYVRAVIACAYLMGVSPFVMTLR